MTDSSTSSPIPGQVLVCGDWHGDWTWAAGVIRYAASIGVRTLVQVGDLNVGFYPEDRDAVASLEPVLAECGVQMIFLDGNHDNHSYLGILSRRADGLVALSQHLSYAPRGTRLTLDTPGGPLRCGFLGGAISVNRNLLTPGVDYWFGEATTPADVSRLGSAPLDVLFTHDAPIPGRGDMGLLAGPGLRGIPEQAQKDSDRVRELLHRAVAATRPSLVVCGHWHKRVSGHTEHPGGRTRVELLHMQRRVENMVLLTATDYGPQVGSVDYPSYQSIKEPSR
ncbi:metallophosphoesterase (plasmid) [Citricoccus nitrophenolicus]